MAREHPNAIQVLEHKGVKYVLGSPRVEGDSLTGYVKGVERRMPMASIDQGAVRRFSSIKTLGLVVGIPLAGVATILGIYGIGCAIGGNCSSFAP
jgi:hypothetical protein